MNKVGIINIVYKPGIVLTSIAGLSSQCLFNAVRSVKQMAKNQKLNRMIFGDRNNEEDDEDSNTAYGTDSGSS